MTTVWPSRRMREREPMTPANSTRVKAPPGALFCSWRLVPSRMVTGSEARETSCAMAGATPPRIGPSAIAPTAPSATEVLAIDFLEEEPAISAHTRARALSTQLMRRVRLVSAGL